MSFQAEFVTTHRVAQHTLQGHTGGVWGLAFSPDGTVLASAGLDGTVRLWDPASRESIGTLESHTG